MSLSPALNVKLAAVDEFSAKVDAVLEEHEDLTRQALQLSLDRRG